MKENEVKSKVSAIVENAVLEGYTREELDKELRAYLGKPVSESVDIERNDWECIATIDETCDCANFVVSAYKAYTGQFIIYSYEIID